MKRIAIADFTLSTNLNRLWQKRSRTRMLVRSINWLITLAAAFLLTALLGTIWEIHHVLFSLPRIPAVQFLFILEIVEASVLEFGPVGVLGGVCALLLHKLAFRNSTSLSIGQIALLVFTATVMAGPACTWYLHLAMPKVPLNFFSWAMPALLSFVGASATFGFQLLITNKWNRNRNEHLFLRIPILNASTAELSFLKNLEVELSEAVSQSGAGSCHGSDSQDAAHTIFVQGVSVDRALLEVKPVLEKYSLPAGSYLQIGNSKKLATKILL